MECIVYGLNRNLRSRPVLENSSAVRHLSGIKFAEQGSETLQIKRINFFAVDNTSLWNDQHSQ